MARLWITYAWKDNEQNDVDYVVQELRKAGCDVQLDRYALGAGRRLWEQIGDRITNPKESDAWAIYATENSLASEPCKEELAIALDRALRARGEVYPLIGIFPTAVAPELIPPAIRVRLYVTLTDSNWTERVISATEGREPTIRQHSIPPIFQSIVNTGKQIVVEVRPRVGRWYPCYVVVPKSEANRLDTAMVAPSGSPPSGGMTLVSTFDSGDGQWKVTKLGHEATPQQSVFAFFNRLPSALAIGPKEGPFHISLT